MDVEHDERLQRDAVLCGQLAPHHGDDLVDLIVVQFKVLLQSVAT